MCCVVEQNYAQPAAAFAYGLRQQRERVVKASHLDKSSAAATLSVSLIVSNVGSHGSKSAAQWMPWGHFSHVTDVSGLSAQTLALAAHAKTNVSAGLPAQVPACGHEFIIPDFESPLQVALCVAALLGLWERFGSQTDEPEWRVRQVLQTCWWLFFFLRDFVTKLCVLQRH